MSQHVVITGGTGALGQAVVAALRADGAECYVPVFEEAELSRFPLRDDAGVHLVPGVDLRDEASVEAFYAGLPALDASIQIAGGFAMSTLESTGLADLEGMLALNVHTCFLACREATKKIRAGGRGGRLVNVAARPALVPTAGMLAYSVSKSAVAGLTLALAEELAHERIWVNAVVPSVMDTPANRASMPTADHARWPKVAEVAQAIVALASPNNGCMRGALVPVYGQS